MPLTLKNINYAYNAGTALEKKVLKDVSLTFREGEFTAIIGPTGSGKSTLIQHLDLLLTATSGELLFNGENVYAGGYDRKALRSRVGLVFQYPEYQLFEPEIFTDVCFGPKNQGLPEAEVHANAREAMKLVGLDESYDTLSPFEISGGQKRRVAIAGVLAMKPDFLVLDEPAAGLDPQGKKELLDLIRRLCTQAGKGIILVSHSMDDVAEYADRIIVLKDGTVRLDGTPHEVFRHREELVEMGLSVPKVTEVLCGLKARGFDVDTGLIGIAETKEEILRLFR